VIVDSGAAGCSHCFFQSFPASALTCSTACWASHTLTWVVGTLLINRPTGADRRVGGVPVARMMVAVGG